VELALAIASRSALEDETSCLRFSGGCALPSSAIEPIRTDFKGYEGKFVALDARTGKIVLADEDPRVVLEKAKGAITWLSMAGFHMQMSQSMWPATRSPTSSASTSKTTTAR
jgi:hypothetical protein